MFEMESQTSHSGEGGASSDVTKSATSKLTELQQQIKRLETENKVLHGRIRGYKTLGDLLQEAKEENKRLSEEKKLLAQRLDTCSSIQETFEKSLNGTEPASMKQEESQNPDTAQNTDLSPITDLTMTKVSDEIENAQQELKMKERSIAVTRDNTDESQEETCGSIREVTAMQESITETQNDLSRTDNSGQPKEANTIQNLELDSDRFEEPEYEKVGRQMTSKPGSMSSMSVISSGPDEKYNFPSLSSGTPQRGQDARPKVYNDFDVKPSTSIQDPELSAEMQRVLQMHSIEGGLDLAAKFRKISEDIAKTEEDAKKFKNLAYTFAQENQKLKTSTTLEIKQLRNKVFELQEDNKRLMSHIKTLEHSHDDLLANSDSLTSQTHVMDWVRVECPKGMLDNELFQHNEEETSLTGDMDSVMANVRELRKQNKQLKDANHTWNKKWQELTQQWELKVDHMRTQVAQHKQEVEEVRKKEKQLKMDCERLVSNAKAQAHEEENAKEEALNQLHQATNQIRAHQDQISDLELRLDSMVREKHNLEAEISVLKSRSQGQLLRAGTRAVMCEEERTRDDLKTEIEVLRQQLTVFEEDFDRERQDRAAAQSTRDELETRLNLVVMEKDMQSHKIRTLEQKLKTQENIMQQTLKRNENLQSQIRDAQNRNQQLMEQMQAMSNNYQMRLQPLPMFTNQTIAGMSPQGHMGGMGMSAQGSPQAGAFNYQHMHMPNQQMPFMNFQPMTQVPAPTDTNIKWTCQECTFANIPSRTVCEMCGRVRRMTASAASSMSEPVLMSRDVVHPPPLSRGTDVPDENTDLVTDNGIFQ